jgi:hypothetical protein
MLPKFFDIRPEERGVTLAAFFVQFGGLAAQTLLETVICHVRVDFAHDGGVARGHSAEDARRAVSRASAQIRAAAVEHISGTLAVHVRRML